MQNEDFAWFVENLSKLYEMYGSAYLAIKEKQVIGVYNSFAEGVKKTLLNEKPGTFIVQQCGKDESCYTNYIASTNFMM